MTSLVFGFPDDTMSSAEIDCFRARFQSRVSHEDRHAISRRTQNKVSSKTCNRRKPPLVLILECGAQGARAPIFAAMRDGGALPQAVTSCYSFS